MDFRRQHWKGASPSGLRLLRARFRGIHACRIRSRRTEGRSADQGRGCGDRSQACARGDLQGTLNHRHSLALTKVIGAGEQIVFRIKGNILEWVSVYLDTGRNGNGARQTAKSV